MGFEPTVVLLHRVNSPNRSATTATYQYYSLFLFAESSGIEPHPSSPERNRLAICPYHHQSLLSNVCAKRDSNPHVHGTHAPQACLSTNSSIRAYSIYKDFPLSIGAYLKLFIQAISLPPRLGIEPRLSTISYFVDPARIKPLSIDFFVDQTGFEPAQCLR